MLHSTFFFEDRQKSRNGFRAAANQAQSHRVRTRACSRQRSLVAFMQNSAALRRDKRRTVVERASSRLGSLGGPPRIIAWPFRFEVPVDQSATRNIVYSTSRFQLGHDGYLDRPLSASTARNSRAVSFLLSFLPASAVSFIYSRPTLAKLGREK